MSRHRQFKTRFWLVIILLVAGPLVQAQSFYAFLVADTKDSLLGASCKKDLSDISATLRHIAGTIDYDYREIVCQQDQFGSEGIRDAILQINCKPEDVIFFYYSGHGINNASAEGSFPVLDLKGQNLGVETIHRLLKKKSPKLCISMADCCNHLPAGVIAAMPLKRGIVVSDDSEKLRRLFVHTRGDLLVSSARKGEVATAHADGGSFYSNTWLQALAHAGNHQAPITWEALLADAEHRLQETLKDLPEPMKHRSQWAANISPDTKR